MSDEMSPKAELAWKMLGAATRPFTALIIVLAKVSVRLTINGFLGLVTHGYFLYYGLMLAGVLSCMSLIGLFIGGPLLILGFVLGIFLEPMGKWAARCRERLDAEQFLSPSNEEVVFGFIGFVLLCGILWLLNR